MKNYNTLEGLEKHYISNTELKGVDASSIYGKGVYYYPTITIRNSFQAFAMVNINTLDYILRCDPSTDEEYEAFEDFCNEYENPEWVVLS